MKNIPRFIAIILTLALAFSLCACVNGNQPKTEKSTEGSNTESTEKTTDAPVDNPTEAPSQEPSEPQEKGLYSVTPINQAKAGDIVVFGTYEQDGNTENGKEPLEWLVLSGGDGSLLLITLYAVEHMVFHDSSGKVTWETSDLRGWLNNDFIHAAFSSEESGKILMTSVIAEKNPDYPNSPAGNDTEDKVFILSIQEAKQYFNDNNSRICVPTDKARASAPNLFSQSSRKAWYSDSGYTCSWWLRSPGMFKDLYVSYVDKYGNTSSGGQVNLTNTDFCVRPSMWIRVN